MAMSGKAGQKVKQGTGYRAVKGKTESYQALMVTLDSGTNKRERKRQTTMKPNSTASTSKAHRRIRAESSGPFSGENKGPSQQEGVSNKFLCSLEKDARIRRFLDPSLLPMPTLCFSLQAVLARSTVVGWHDAVDA